MQKIKRFNLINKNDISKFFLYLTIGFITPILLQCSVRNPLKEKVTVFGAASMSGYLQELKDSLEKENCKLELNIASSGTLARQLAQGAKADFYISANEKWANYTDSLNLAHNVEPFCENMLVGILPKSENGGPQEWDILSYNKIAIGNPSHVPAGEYAVDVLNKLQVFDSLTGKLIFTKDVKSALRLVELKECDAGMVYFSDAAASVKVDVAYVPARSFYTSPLVFLVKLRGENENHTIFESSLSIDLLKKHGFKPVIK